MNWFSFPLSLPLLAFACVSSATAAMVYDNGAPNRLNGFEISHWIQADDFPLGTAARLESVKFWTFEGSGNFQGSIVWQIYSNRANNTPGTLLFSGTSTNLAHTATGFTLGPYAEFSTTFDLPPVSLPAGSYWLGLHNGPLSNTSDTGRVYWGTTNTVDPTPSRSLVAPFAGPWFSNEIPAGARAGVAFQVSGIPAGRVTELTFNNDNLRIGFTTAIGQTYRLEYKNALTDASWTPVSGADEIAGTGAIVEVSDPDSSARNVNRRFYRARLCPCQTIEGPRLTGFDFAPVPRISFTTVAGQLYRVEFKDDAASALWTTLPGAEMIPGTGATIQISDDDPGIPNLPRRFYRATLLP